MPSTLHATRSGDLKNRPLLTNHYAILKNRSESGVSMIPNEGYKLKIEAVKSLFIFMHIFTIILNTLKLEFLCVILIY